MYSDANPLPFNYINLFCLESFRMSNSNDILGEKEKEKMKEKEKLFFEINKLTNNYLDSSYTRSINFPPHVNV
jgi:hypothetical protein